MKYINTLLLIFITKLVIAQTEPQWVNASPFPNNYNGIIKGMFLNANEGWIWQVSKYKANKLYYTNDGAETFSKIYELTDSANRFFWVQMLDNKTGYSSTGFSTIYGFLKTNDGGLNWTNIPIDTAFLNQFNFPYQGEYYFTDTLTGFTNRYIDGEGLALYKTINGGINWQKANIVGIEEAGLIPVELGYVTKFFFIDAMHGWALVSYAMGAGICLSTSDGGETWQVAHNHGTDFFGIDFISTQKGGIVGRSAYFSHVYLTEDNFLSLSYENQAWDYEMQQYAYTIAYQNDSTVWISRTPGTFYRSIDNGYSFQEFEKLPFIIISPHFLNWQIADVNNDLLPDIVLNSPDTLITPEPDTLFIYPDSVITGYRINRFFVFYNLGNFELSIPDTIYYREQTVINGYSTEISLTCSDLNGDGWKDMAFTRGIGTRIPNLCILYNNGSGKIIGEELPTGIVTQQPVQNGSLTCYPNPFTQQTTIEFQLQKTAIVTLYISDITGRVVKHFTNHKKLKGGKHFYEWIPQNSIHSGIYNICLQSKNNLITQKIIKN
ncbi:MAG: T9SS type A sorting domain-containing protein [Salinivirgaceae bacterium]|nr:T9SS type A sorting domain-containing protein [Salinivirgaceae bacterium]